MITENDTTFFCMKCQTTKPIEQLGRKPTKGKPYNCCKDCLNKTIKFKERTKK